MLADRSQCILREALREVGAHEDLPLRVFVEVASEHDGFDAVHVVDVVGEPHAPRSVEAI